MRGNLPLTATLGTAHQTARGEHNATQVQAEALAVMFLFLLPMLLLVKPGKASAGAGGAQALAPSRLCRRLKVVLVLGPTCSPER